MKFFTNNSKVGKFAGNLSIVAVMVLLVTSLLGISQKLNLLPDHLSSMLKLETVKEKIVQTSTKSSNIAMASMPPCPGLVLECVGKVNLSLDAMCTGSIQADMLFSNPTGLPQDTFVYVIQEPGGAIRANNLFTNADLGKTFKVSVSVKGCDTPPCWSNLLIEDKTKPVLDCPRDTIDCYEPLSDIKLVTQTDNCSGSTLSQISSIFTPFTCNQVDGVEYLGFYTRKYRAVDTYMNDTMCDQIVLVRRPNFTALSFPLAITIACQEIAPIYGGFPPPKTSGWPQLNGADVTFASNTLCMADLSYKDSLITPSTVCRKVIKRDWELIQWTCGSPVIRRGSQFITVIDTIAPSVVNLADMTLNVTSSRCEANVTLPPITATDNCQTNLFYEVTHPRGTIFTNGGVVSLPAGVHFVYYKVTDGTCGNVTYDTIRVTMIDRVAPVAVCQHDPIVSISNNGIGTISAAALNNNSYDDCNGVVSIKVRRMEAGCGNDSMWVDSVKYCCADVDNPNLMIALRVMDANGNTNICMTNIKVQNKIVPDAVFPNDTIVKCSFAFSLSSLGSVFGQPRIIGTACSNSGSFKDTVTMDNRDACGIGSIRRTMYLIHNGKIIKSGNQIITIVQDSIFNPATIMWPDSAVYVTGSIDTSITGSPKIPFIPCNMIAINVTTDTFPMNSNGTCAKYYRTWKVINWCGINRGAVIATFTQTIILEDKEPPVITLPVPDITVCSFADNCSARELAVITVGATDTKTPVAGLIWTYDIDLFNNGSVDTSGNGRTMSYLSVLGRHRVTFTVRDGCGNSATTSVMFEVKNCKPPTAQCKSLIIRLDSIRGSAGEVLDNVEVCARDFNAKSTDLCTDSTLLKFTFDEWFPVMSSLNVVHYFKGDGIPATLAEYEARLAQRWDPIRMTSCKILTCADSPSRKLTVTVWDLDRNKGICQPTIMVMGANCCTDRTPPVINPGTRDTLRIDINRPDLTCLVDTLITLGANATDNVTTVANLMWRYEVDLGNNGSINASGTGNNTLYRIGIGTHRINLYVEDSCRNSDTLTYIVKVRNVTPPTARCRTNPLAVTLIDFDGVGPMLPMYFLRADTLNNASTPSSDVCTPADRLIYTFSGAFPVQDLITEVHWFTGNGVISNQAAYLAGNAQQWNPSTRTSTTKLQCGDRGARTYTMTVWDEDRLSTSCTVTVNISGPCPCNDNIAPVIPTSDTLRLICSNSLICSTLTNVVLSATATDNIPSNLLSWTFSIDLNNNGSVDTAGVSNSVNYLAPLGTHKVTFVVSDTCDNRDTLVYLFNVRNCVPPTCTTRNFTLIPAIVPNSTMSPMVEVRADSLVVSKSDPCTPSDSLVITFGATYPVRATFNTVHFFKGNGLTATQAEFDAGTAQRWMPTVRASVIKLFCSGGNSRTMIVTVTDQDNRTSTCSSVVTLICPQSLCETNDYSGFMVATCNAESGRLGVNEPVAVLYDVRQNLNAPRNRSWNTAPFYGSNWYIDSIGQVFGIAIDDSANVFLAGSDVYLIRNNQPAGISTGNIYMSKPPLFRADLVVNLPNFGDPFNGIGNIVYNRVHNTLFASNLEDGKIYRINPFTKTILDSFDPWVADGGGINGIVAQTEQVWGLGMNYEAGGVVKLYFARIGSTGRQMYSVTLSAAGTFPAAGSEVIEINNLPGDEIRITDIAFSNDGRKMLWAERGGSVKVDFANGIPSPPIIDGSHSNIVAEYLKPATTWIFSKEYKVGSNVKQEFGSGNEPSIPNSIEFGQNSAGGVDYGFEQSSLTNAFSGIDSIVWASGNWLHKGVSFQPGGGDDSLYYGIQGISTRTIGNVRTDIVVDFDNNGINFPDKGLVGDVEIHRCRYNPAFQNNLVANVTGEIYTRTNEVLEGATVRLVDQSTMQTTTNADGRFEFKQVTGGAEYIVKPTKNDDALNGVDALDMLRLQKHILGIKKFDNPYDYIAADVDGDKKVTVADLVDVRKVILGVKETFAVNQSWKMIDANTTFSDIRNPWNQPLAEEYYISKLNEDMWIDFKAIKLADLNGSAIANKASTNTRSNSKVTLTKGLPIQKDGKMMLPIYGENNDLSALHLALEGVPFGIEVVSGALSIETANVFTSEKKMQIIYTNPSGSVINTSSPLFYLAAKNGDYDQIRLASGIAYLNDEVSRQLEIRNHIDAKSIDGPMVLNQNQPNPWSAQTTISYELPKAGKVSIAIYDIAGRRVYLNVIDALKGRNDLTINASDMPSTGVYHYTLQFEGQLLNKRLIHIAK